ncbi:DNA/RNA helicase [Mycobacterium tuberculosis]|nr:DNA/RNA helicase [Mycobacterium tuberculosis]
MDYTRAQRMAINTLDDPLLIVACAGSGKTQVISQRIIEILKRDGVRPGNVVAFTFTDKAAAELKDRVTGLATAEFGNIHGLAELYIGTMHGYALDLLTTHVPNAFKYGVLSDIQARLFIDRNSRESGLTTTTAIVQGKPRKLKRYSNSKLYMQVLNILREDEIDETRLSPELIEAVEGYRRLLHGHSYFDYTELLYEAVELLGVAEADPTGGALVRHVRDNIRYVVVDEYQDTNPVQERLIRGLCRFGANLCVVGDDDQTIYQWRGSAVSNILTFAERSDDVRVVTLDDNFRSGTGIVALGQAVAEQNTQRLDKRMVAAGHQRFDRGDLLALSFGDPEEEARWICDRIERFRGVAFTDSPDAEPRGLSWSDFAVLFRSVKSDADELVAELRHRDIPYVIKGLTRLFDAPEIQACVACFQYMLGEIDDDELRSRWADAGVGATDADIDRGIAVLENGRTFEQGARWGAYNIQRVYLDFLEAIGLREERVPGDPTRGELVFYNLGKFSQVISDFEDIHFKSEPRRKYDNFVKWLVYQAPEYYAESDADVGYATPDAVTIATVHQAKGMQWPYVFVPAMRRNRFPAARIGGLNTFHVIPEAAVPDADRYRGTVDDETRLFYVALTRAQKYLSVTYSPGRSSRYQARSAFYDFVTRNPYVLTAEPPLGAVERLEPRPRHETPEVTLSFSELKYFFECPYQFKLRFLYGFNPPIHEALGYGKSVHDVMAEIHKRAVDNDIVQDFEVEELVERHLHTPFAYPALRAQLESAAIGAVRRYLAENGDRLDRTVHSELKVQVHVAPGITVDGRIDLIRYIDTGELAIADFKSTERAQAEEITRAQLHTYVVGYEELSGNRADLVEILNLDERSPDQREVVDDSLLLGIRTRIRDAGTALRENDLPRHTSWCGSCANCDLAGICRDRET